MGSPSSEDVAPVASESAREPQLQPPDGPDGSTEEEFHDKDQSTPEVTDNAGAEDVDTAGPEREEASSHSRSPQSTSPQSNDPKPVPSSTVSPFSQSSPSDYPEPSQSPPATTTTTTQHPHPQTEDMSALRDQNARLEQRVADLEAALRRLSSPTDPTPTSPATPGVAPIQKQPPSAFVAMVWYLLTLPWDVLRKQVVALVKDTVTRGVRQFLLFLYVRRCRKWAVRTVQALLLRLRMMEGTVVEQHIAVVLGWSLSVLALEGTLKLLK
ncbi:hypothetical protein HDU96_008510 [Phlyctochytrium bullatum]|nr:hypothetical protein HDU96_008510 [Phlyctochytrium bullatum]